MSTIDAWKSVDLTSYEGRLKTFQDWSMSYIKPEDLAKAGFFYTGIESNDTVECFSCRIALGHWEEDDDLQKEHKKASPKCAYVLNPTTQTVPPLHPKFNTFNARLETFKLSGKNINQMSFLLAEAGLFYAGESDYCKCYYCGVVLKDWQITDQPWKAHAYFSSDCDYLQMVKGPNFINNAINNEREYNDNIEEKQQDVSEEDLCKVCASHETSVVAVPCGHVFCPRCVLSVETCPTCRSNIEETVRYIM